MRKLILILLLTSCVPHRETHEKTLFKKYVLVGIHRPKHFHIDLVEVDTWVRYDRVTVSKHFSGWQSLVLGDTIEFQKHYYHQGGNQHEEFMNVRETLKNHIDNRLKKAN